MFELSTPEITILHGVTFLAISSMVLLIYMLAPKSQDRLALRLQKLQTKEEAAPASKPIAQLAKSLLPSLGNPFIPKDEEERTKLQTRLIYAGLYGRQALVIYLGVKMLLTVGPLVFGLLVGLSGLIPIVYGLIFGAFLGIFGIIVPSFWLDRQKAKRQMAFRRALPDTLDVLVICLEGGLSLPSAVRRVSSELRTAHPGLALELLIVQREVQLGRTTGEALRNFGERCGLQEVRSLASVINQAERFGAGLVKVLRTHAGTLRGRRLHFAEEMAQKAAIKILFPTLLFIFPGIFLIILGPAAIQLVETFSNMMK